MYEQNEQSQHLPSQHKKLNIWSRKPRFWLVTGTQMWRSQND